jgi:hypothetical protein
MVGIVAFDRFEVGQQLAFDLQASCLESGGVSFAFKLGQKRAHVAAQRCIGLSLCPEPIRPFRH